MKFFRSLLAVVVLLTFAFLPTTSYADDPCAPISAGPLLYQINRTPTEATLFFSPVATDQIQSYTVMYGYKAEDERFSTTFNQGVSTGAISYTLGGLEPGVQYFYKVSGNTSCVNSPWSSWEGDKPVTKGTSTNLPGIPVAGIETIYLWGTISFLIITSGFGLFALSKRRA